MSYAGAAKELIALAERYQIPVVTSLLGQGTIATSHPLFPRDGRNARILRGQYRYDRDGFHDQCWLSI